VFAIVYYIFGSAPGKKIWAAMAFYGLYYAMTNPVLKARVVQAAPNDARGRALGILYFVSSVMALSASVATGELWSILGRGSRSTLRLDWRTWRLCWSPAVRRQREGIN
jgi:hypothetical protein